MKKTISFILAILSFGNIALAADQLGPDKFTMRPADPNSINRNDLIYEVKPGDEMNDQIILKNLTPAEKKFTLYVTEAVRQKDGSLAFKNVADKRQMADWINLDTNEATLKSEEEKMINVHIKIPKDTPLGDYLGGIAGVKTEPSISNPNLNIAIRNILNIQLKITNTPTHIQKLSEVKKDGQTNLLFQGPTPFFYGTTALFLVCASYYIMISRKEKKLTKTQNNVLPKK